MSVIALTPTSLHKSSKRQIKLRVSDPAQINNYLESAALILQLSRKEERFSSLTSHLSQWLFRADFKVQRRKNWFNQQEANKFCRSNKTRRLISEYNYLTFIVTHWSLFFVWHIGMALLKLSLEPIQMKSHRNHSELPLKHLVDSFLTNLSTQDLLRTLTQVGKNTLKLLLAQQFPVFGQQIET